MHWLYIQKIDETENYLLEEIKHNDFISEEQLCATLKYFELLLILVFAVTGCFFISVFAYSFQLSYSYSILQVCSKNCSIFGIKHGLSTISWAMNTSWSSGMVSSTEISSVSSEWCCMSQRWNFSSSLVLQIFLKHAVGHTFSAMFTVFEGQ